MGLPNSLQGAVKALAGALDLLEAAIERRVQADAARADREQEIALMQEDRAQLGEDLERSEQSNECLRAAGAAALQHLAQMEALCISLRQRAAD